MENSEYIKLSTKYIQHCILEFCSLLCKDQCICSTLTDRLWTKPSLLSNILYKVEHFLKIMETASLVLSALKIPITGCVKCINALTDEWLWIFVSVLLVRKTATYGQIGNRIRPACQIWQNCLSGPSVICQWLMDHESVLRPIAATSTLGQDAYLYKAGTVPSILVATSQPKSVPAEQTFLLDTIYQCAVKQFHLNCQLNRKE